MTKQLTFALACRKMAWLKLLLILLIFVLYAIVALPFKIFAQDDSEIITKTACLSALSYDDLDFLKDDLLLKVKRGAVNELFGELIIASTDVENFVVTNDEIRASSVGFIREQGDILFFNSDNLAEVCVTIDAFATEDDREKFKPVKIEKRDCASEPDLSTRDVKELARKKAVIQALIDYDRKLENTNEEDLLQLMRRVTYSESGFIDETETYCTSVKGYVLPIEILTLLAEGDITKSRIDGEDLVADRFQIDVHADSNSIVAEPLKTNMFLSEGDRLSITVAADDTWSAGDESRISNADGLSPDNEHGDSFEKYSSDGRAYYYGSLVGKIGNSEYFFIGTNFSQTIEEGGQLYLAFWDKNSDDNVGSITADILHYRTQSKGIPTENIAMFSTVTASSTYNACYSADNVTDGSAKGYPVSPCNEWASRGERDGAWLRLDFEEIVHISRVVIHDRPNTADNILSGKLLFSDGSSEMFGQLPNDGSAETLIFEERNVKWVKLIIDKGTGPNVGISEIEIHGRFE